MKYKLAHDQTKAKSYALDPQGVNFVTIRKANKVMNEVRLKWLLKGFNQNFPFQIIANNPLFVIDFEGNYKLYVNMEYINQTHFKLQLSTLLTMYNVHASEDSRYKSMDTFNTF